MIPFIDELEKIKVQIIEKYAPCKIILFGSCARGIAKENSDFDICVICSYTDKKETLIDMMLSIDSDRDIDFILYRPCEWETYINDNSSFASLINKEGVVLYG